MKGGGVAQGVVVVGLGGEVDDDVGLRHQRVDRVGVGDVPHDEVDALAQVRERPPVAGVGEFVEHRHRRVGVAHEGLVDEVGADEAGAPGDEDVHGWSSVVPSRGRTIAAGQGP